MSKWDEQRPTSPYGSPQASTPPARPGSVAPALPDYVQRDILAYVERALGRFAVPGQVRFQDYHLYLQAGGAPVPPVSIATWANDWARMDEATRRRRAEEAARELSRGRSLVPAPQPARRLVFVDPTLLLALGILALIILWISVGEDFTSRDPNTHPNAQATRGETAPIPHERNSADGDSKSGRPTEAALSGKNSGEARSSRVCGATLTRVFQGGSVSVADVDGFRVEIALLRQGGKEPLETHPALARFVQNPTAATGSRFIWDAEPGLASVETSDSVVVVRRLVLGEGDARIFGATISFGGSLVDPYFKEAERSRYFHIASSIADAIDATHVAVYARCFDRPLHALGSWFRGADAGGAISSLVYFMGTYARPLHLAKPFAHPPGESELNRLHAFRSIQEKTATLTRADLATLLGKEGGMATGRDGEQVIITFPFGDENRASRASRGIVRVAGLGL